MTIGIDKAAAGRVPAWETWVCQNPLCSEGSQRLRRRSPEDELWELQKRPGWLMAASMPVCPSCGGSLVQETVAKAAGRNE
jgi:hypothetical protein